MLPHYPVKLKIASGRGFSSISDGYPVVVDLARGIVHNPHRSLPRPQVFAERDGQGVWRDRLGQRLEALVIEGLVPAQRYRPDDNTVWRSVMETMTELVAKGVEDPVRQAYRCADKSSEYSPGKGSLPPGIDLEVEI